MGAAKHDAVDACIQQRHYFGVDVRDEFGTVELERFDARRPTRAGLDMDLTVGGVALDQPLQAFAARGGLGRQDGDLPRLRALRRRLHAGLDADDRDAGMLVAQLGDGMGGRCIAGNDQQAAAAFDQMMPDGQHPAANEVVVLVAIGNMGGVGEIGQIGLGQGTGDRGKHRKAAQSGIEDADQFFLQPISTAVAGPIRVKLIESGMSARDSLIGMRPPMISAKVCGSKGWRSGSA